MVDTVIDAEGMILGRLASEAAERLKTGEEVRIVNSDLAVVSGKPEKVYDKYRKRRDTGSKYKGPHFPKAADRIVKRTVRGMLPDSSDGREAFKRLKTYTGNPEDLETDDVDVKKVQDLKSKQAVTVGDISENI